MQIRDLQVLAYALEFTLWLYKAPVDDKPTEPGYFADAAGMFNPGDLVLVTQRNPRGDMKPTAAFTVNTTSPVVTLV